MRRTMEAYHLAGHTVVLRLLQGSGRRLTLVAGQDGRAGSGRSPAGSRTAAWTVLERRLVVAAAGAAAERELACRAGLPWRHVSNRCDGLAACRQGIAEETGENADDWIHLHWIRAVTRARRVLTATWAEVVRAAENLGLRSGVDEVGPCPTAIQTGARPRIASVHAWRGPT